MTLLPSAPPHPVPLPPFPFSLLLSGPIAWNSESARFHASFPSIENTFCREHVLFHRAQNLHDFMRLFQSIPLQASGGSCVLFCVCVCVYIYIYIQNTFYTEHILYRTHSIYTIYIEKTVYTLGCQHLDCDIDREHILKKIKKHSGKIKNRAYPRMPTLRLRHPESQDADSTHNEEK